MVICYFISGLIINFSNFVIHIIIRLPNFFIENPLKAFSELAEIMPMTKYGIPAEVFYSGRNPRQDKIEAIIKKQSSGDNTKEPKYMTQLLGPSKTWKVFKKQQDAIDCCFRRRNGLMPFAYEDINGRRMFLAAHPKAFWARNAHRFFKNCCSYEIIREYSACKLYLDIEYKYEYNNKNNGIRMLDNMLNIININLRNLFNVICTKNDILDLDSSSDCKFSHHVIYEIRNLAFQDNYTVGTFIKQICRELREAFESNALGNDSKLLEICEKYGLSQRDVLELFIKDQKGQIKLFIDEGVYTKNRHFRLLGSSKLAKHVPLKISEENKYTPKKASDGLDYFLDSLITYFSWKVEKVIEFEESEKPYPHKVQKRLNMKEHEGTESFMYPQIDSFIRNLISPKGWIRKKFYFSDSSTVVYDIQGYRYCHKIKREHKNNNIKYIVDLKTLSFYQKCYDPDCADFRSAAKPLPEEICFLFEDDSLFVSESPEFEENFVQAIEKIEYESEFEQSVSDEVLEEVVDCTEAILNTCW